MSKLLTRIAALTLTIPLSLPAFAALDTFLKVPGAPGESVDKAHPKEIEVLTWAWGATNQGKDGALLSPFTWTQELDNAFVPLFLGLTQDAEFDPVQLSVRKVTGDTAADFFKMTLIDAHVLSLSSAGNADNIIVTGSMGYSGIEMSYCPLTPKGTLGTCVKGSFSPTSTGAMAFSGDAQVLRGLAEAGGLLNLNIATVPEPSSSTAALTGLALLGGLACGRRAWAQLRRRTKA